MRDRKEKIIATSRIEWAILAGFSLFFALLFLRYPLRGALPSNTDAWMFISIANEYIDLVSCFFSGKEAGSALWPIDNIFFYGETFPATAAIFMLFRYLGAGDITAYYLFMVTGYALTAYGVYLLANSYIGNRWAAIFCGFAFSCSNFMFANLDNAYLEIFFLPALSLYFYRRFLVEKRPGLILLAAAMAALQIYLAVYTFIYQLIILAIAAAVNIRRLIKNPSRIYLLHAFVLFSLIVLPYVAFTMHARGEAEIDEQDGSNSMAAIEIMSLKPTEIFSVLPGNVIYDTRIDIREGFNKLRFYKPSAFIGFLVLLLAVFGLTSKKKGRLELVLMAVIGLVLAMGPKIRIGESEFTSIAYWIYRDFPLFSYLRFTFRAYFITALAVSLLAGFGLSRIMELIGHRRKLAFASLVFAAMAIHFVENVPMPPEYFEGEAYAEPSPGYLGFFEGREEVVLDLPSGLTFLLGDWDGSDKSLYKVSREIIYRNWRAKHGQNILGGFAGYQPEKRKLIQAEINRLPDRNAVDKLAKLGLEYIVFHKRMKLPRGDIDLDRLLGSPCMKLVFDDDRTAILEIKEDDCKRRSRLPPGPPLFIPQYEID